MWWRIGICPADGPLTAIDDASLEAGNFMTVAIPPDENISKPEPSIFRIQNVTAETACPFSASQSPNAEAGNSRPIHIFRVISNTAEVVLAAAIDRISI